MTDASDTPSAPAGRTWRTFKNSLYGVVEYAWPIVIALVASPYIVHTLGDAAYGVLAIVGVSMGFLGFLDLGIGSAATRQISVYYEKEEHENVDAVVGTSVAFYLGIGIVAGALIAAAAGPLVGHVLSIPPNLQPTARIAFFVSAAAFPITLTGGAFAAVPRALQRFDLTTKVGMVFGTVGPFMTVAVLWLGGGLLGVMVVSTVLGLINVPINYLIARRLVPTLSVRPKLNLGMLRELFSFGGFFLLSTLAVLLLYQLDKLLISWLLGVAAVTYYVVPGNLAQRIQGFASAAVGIVFPVSAALSEAGDTEGMGRLYQEGTRLICMLVVCMAVPMSVFAYPFLNAWMGPHIANSSAHAMVFLVWTYALLGSTGVAWSITNGAGLAKVNAVFTLGLAAIDIALFFVLARPFGVAGAAAAYFASALIGVPILLWYSERRVLGKSGFEFTKVWLRVGTVAIAQYAIALLLRLAANGLIPTLGMMAVSAGSFFLLYWAFGFMQEGDRRLLSLLTARLKP